MPVQQLDSYFVPSPRQQCDSKIVECLQVIIGMCGNEPYAYQQELIVEKAMEIGRLLKAGAEELRQL